MIASTKGLISLVPTPIGNLGDITLRAVDTLRRADLICAEDTRHTGILLKHLEIKKPLLSFHEHNEARRTPDIVERALGGEHIAVVSDAGMPGISDPGFRLVRACHTQDVPVEILPGASSVLMALIGSGFASDAFYFGGFLPVKSGRKARILHEALARDCTSIFFESPHRLVKTLSALVEMDPSRRICIARELTKKFEEYRRDSVQTLLSHYEKNPPKGEICLVMEGKKI